MTHSGYISVPKVFAYLYLLHSMVESLRLPEIFEKVEDLFTVLYLRKDPESLPCVGGGPKVDRSRYNLTIG